MKEIFIIEDEIVVAKDIECILSEEKQFKVIDIATSYEIARRKLRMVKPHLILCDINLKGPKTGIDLMGEVMQQYNIPFIFITAYSDVETLEKAGRLKPHNYITKPFNEKQLISSVKIALLASDNTEVSTPTNRELSVIKLLAKGLSSKQIAEILSISSSTVETHRKNLIAKYGINKTAELICLATAKGWVNYQE
ncbi:MAG: response regulator [Bacteroidota bacterium]